MSDPKVIGYAFRSAPGWPAAPAGWTPPEGWTIPTDWPPAPEGWVFYEPIFEPAAEPQPSTQAAVEATEPEVVPQDPPVVDALPSDREPEGSTLGAPSSPRHFEPLAPLPTRHTPAFGKKEFTEGLLAELQQWHDYAGALKRQVFDREGQLESIGGLTVVQLEERKTQLESEVAAQLAERERLQGEVDSTRAELVDVKDRVVLAADGLYSYAHPAESSLELQTRLSMTTNEIKDMVRRNMAVVSSSTFTFNGSAVEGRRWVGDISKLMLRAFNAEAENCVKTVRAGNLAAAQKRLNLSADQIAKLGARMGISVAPAYRALRMTELQIAAEYQERVKQERELERDRREELREAERTAKELAAAREKLEKERQQYLSSAERLEGAGDAEGAARIRQELARVDEEIANVAFREANIRAGHVYVISNIGAFGERMVKIGMTRRLEPKDRVRELGDASVPFRFDTHALIFSKDAVTLETKLHQALADRRVNHVNLRREFFYATPSEVKELVRQVTADFNELVEYNEHADADEFRQSGGAQLTEV